MKFQYIVREDPDGSKECNYSEEIRDDQCDVCLDTTIRDWYITKPFKRHMGTSKSVCINCVENLCE